jgi:cytochrome c biogenesis factor
LRRRLLQIAGADCFHRSYVRSAKPRSRRGGGVTLLGIVVVTAWGAELIGALKPGDTIDIAHYWLSFDGLFKRPGPNYREVVGGFTVRRTMAICSA